MGFLESVVTAGGMRGAYFWVFVGTLLVAALLQVMLPEVRTRSFMALQRAGIAMGIPAQSVFMTLEGRARDKHKQQKELARRVAALKQAQIFQPLTDQEREEIAEHLTIAPFRRAEVMTRQGDRADDLYIIIKGEAEVRYDGVNGASGVVSKLRSGDVFGEMGLMTGEPRSATVVASTDALCYRLDQIGFRDALHRRPALAADIAELLSKWELQLDAAKVELDATHGPKDVDFKSELLRKILEFFRLN